MMNSTNADEFSDNPFRSSGGNNNNNGGEDLFATPNPPPQQQFQQPPQQQQQQQFQPQQQQQFQQQQQPQPDPFNNAQPMMSGPMDNGGGLNQQQMQMQQMPNNNPEQTRSWYGNVMMCLSLDTYRSYFDIDADDILVRMKSAIFDCYKPEHFRNNVVGMAKTDSVKGPDLYGPFWITMTLIFFVAVTSNAHAYFHRTDVEEFEYDINHLLHASTILFTFAFGVPTVFWVTTRCMNMQVLLLADWVCYYGYSLVSFLPLVFLCAIPWGIISWVALLVGTGMSGLLVVRNVTAPLLSSDVGLAKAPPLILAILGTHVIFLLFMKFTFYHH